jgi:hypothetical protein
LKQTDSSGLRFIPLRASRGPAGDRERARTSVGPANAVKPITAGLTTTVTPRAAPLRLEGAATVAAIARPHSS